MEDWLQVSCCSKWQQTHPVASCGYFQMSMERHSLLKMDGGYTAVFMYYTLDNNVELRAIFYVHCSLFGNLKWCCFVFLTH